MTRLLCALSLCLLLLPACAYNNDGLNAAGEGRVAGGPHRAINELALDALMSTTKDARLQRSDLRLGYPVKGPTVTVPGLERVTETEVPAVFRWWVIEGGYTADEPERYNSFRHFYDPLSIEKVPHLTDIIGDGTINPKINARDWALTGKKNSGWGDNAYCWAKGQAYLKAAYLETDAVKKDRLFAQAWRALGETMHLLADMTAIPHVRNDGHPGRAIGIGPIGNTDPNIGRLKNDPYELYTDEAMVRAHAADSLDPHMRARIAAAKDPEDLFYQVASYTQQNFFSADTMAGAYVSHKGQKTQKTVVVTPANGRKSYPLPLLGACAFDEKTGYFTRVINGKKVRVAHVLWTTPIGWGDKAKNGPALARACAADQASILIPVAIAANAKLIDWFLPRMEVQLTAVDAAAHRLTGVLAHQATPTYPDPLNYRPSTTQRYTLWVNGQVVRDTNAYRITLEPGGGITGVFPGLTLEGTDTVELGVDIGGITVRSEPFNLAAAPADMGRVLIGDIFTVDLPVPAALTNKAWEICFFAKDLNTTIPPDDRSSFYGKMGPYRHDLLPVKPVELANGRLRAQVQFVEFEVALEGSEHYGPQHVGAILLPKRGPALSDEEDGRLRTQAVAAFQKVYAKLGRAKVEAMNAETLRYRGELARTEPDVAVRDARVTNHLIGLLAKQGISLGDQATATRLITQLYPTIGGAPYAAFMRVTVVPVRLVSTPPADWEESTDPYMRSIWRDIEDPTDDKIYLRGRATVDYHQVGRRTHPKELPGTPSKFAIGGFTGILYEETKARKYSVNKYASEYEYATTAVGILTKGHLELIVTFSVDANGHRYEEDGKVMFDTLAAAEAAALNARRQVLEYIKSATLVAK